MRFRRSLTRTCQATADFQRQSFVWSANCISSPLSRPAVGALEVFCAWLQDHGVASITAVGSIYVAAYVEELGFRHAAPTVKQRLAAARSMFGWLASGGVLLFNPASAVRGPRHVVKSGKTPVLAPDDARRFLDSIDPSTHAGLRDRALIGLMIYSFARVGAASGMKVEDVFVQNRRLRVRLHEKGGKRHEMPCHHAPEGYLCWRPCNAGNLSTVSASRTTLSSRSDVHGSAELRGSARPLQPMPHFSEPLFAYRARVASHTLSKRLRFLPEEEPCGSSIKPRHLP